MPGYLNDENNTRWNFVPHTAGSDTERAIPAVGKVVYRTDLETLELCTATSPDPTEDGGGTWASLRFGGAWTSFTPNLTAVTTDPTYGTTGHSKVGRYIELPGGLIIARYYFRFGTGMTAGSGTYRFDKPVNAADTDAYSIGFGHIVDNSTGATKVVSVENLGADKVDLLFTAAATPDGIVTHNQPWVWAASDYMAFWIQYEAA